MLTFPWGEGEYPRKAGRPSGRRLGGPCTQGQDSELVGKAVVTAHRGAEKHQLTPARAGSELGGWAWGWAQRVAPGLGPTVRWSGWGGRLAERRPGWGVAGEEGAGRLQTRASSRPEVTAERSGLYSRGRHRPQSPCSDKTLCFSAHEKWSRPSHKREEQEMDHRRNRFWKTFGKKNSFIEVWSACPFEYNGTFRMFAGLCN